MKKLVNLVAMALDASAALAMAAYAVTGWTTVSVPPTENKVVLLGEGEFAGLYRPVGSGPGS